ncbi:hypothetical protein [Zooshikella ganghwensis]|nr:hypothetical protein [Zooshikella ganghwensis]
MKCLIVPLFAVTLGLSLAEYMACFTSCYDEPIKLSFLEDIFD